MSGHTCEYIPAAGSSGKKDRRAFMAAVVATIIIFLQSSGCKKDQGPTAPPPPDSGGIAGGYGTGTLSFDAATADGHFTATGPYKPSDKFAGDTLSEGTGGFVQDTALFGDKIQAMISSYTHSLSNGILKERVLVMGLRNTGGTFVTGAYSFARSNVANMARSVYVYFFLSDSANLYSLFVPKSGAVSIVSFDSTTYQAQGVFFGTLWGPVPDTTVKIDIANGIFDIHLTDKYFSY